jgi:hypothetical protein
MTTTETAAGVLPALADVPRPSCGSPSSASG